MTIEIRLAPAESLLAEALFEAVLIKAGAFAPDGWGDAALGIFAVDGAAAFAGAVKVDGPMERAWADSASLVDFSRI